MKISALILTKNEEEMIEDALKQLKFANEIVVLDKNSTDKTTSIASKYTANIYKTKIEDFDKNRNELASLAKGEWLLYIDADERLTPELLSEIKETIKSDKFQAFYFPRKNYILGSHLKHGGWSPDYVPRLFQKASLVSWQGKVHETPKINGSFGYFKNPLVHKTARNLKLMLSKSIRWAQIEAELYHKAQNPRVTAPKAIKACTVEFLSRYFAKLGFLDGKVGFVAALYQALHRVMIMTYLWEFQNDTKSALKKTQND